MGWNLRKGTWWNSGSKIPALWRPRTKRLQDGVAVREGKAVDPWCCQSSRRLSEKSGYGIGWWQGGWGSGVRRAGFFWKWSSVEEEEEGGDLTPSPSEAARAMSGGAGGVWHSSDQGIDGSEGSWGRSEANVQSSLLGISRWHACRQGDTMVLCLHPKSWPAGQMETCLVAVWSVCCKVDLTLIS